MKRILFLILFCMSLFSGVYAQRIGVKTNSLYWATTTPNLGFEFRTSEQTTFSLFGGYNPFNFSSRVRQDGVKVNPKIRHWLVMPEFRYWFCKAFERGNIGIHGIYGQYNVGGISFIKPLKDYRYQGDAYGGGISYGYHWAVSERWGFEASLGAGFLRLHYKKYDCGECGDQIGEYKRNYLGPTKAALSLIYFLK